MSNKHRLISKLYFFLLHNKNGPVLSVSSPSFCCHRGGGRWSLNNQLVYLGRNVQGV